MALYKVTVLHSSSSLPRHALVWLIVAVVAFVPCCAVDCCLFDSSSDVFAIDHAAPSPLPRSFLLYMLWIRSWCSGATILHAAPSLVWLIVADVVAVVSPHPFSYHDTN
jgi:hypothetical protein